MIIDWLYLYNAQQEALWDWEHKPGTVSKRRKKDDDNEASAAPSRQTKKPSDAKITVTITVEIIEESETTDVANKKTSVRVSRHYLEMN